MKTAELISRHKQVLWARFALRSIVVSLTIAIGALLFRNLDLVPDLSYVDIHVLSGSPDGQYYSLVDALAKTADTQGGKIHNRVSSGSVDNLERLVAGKNNCDVHLGLVQDGFDYSKYQGLEFIGRMDQTESLLLLSLNGDRIKRLVDLKGLTIGIGPEGSGTSYLGEKLLHGKDIESLNIKIKHYPFKQQAELAATGKLDLALFVIDENTKLIADMIRDKGLQVVGLEHAEALSRRIPFLHHGSIAAGQFDTVRVLPPTDKPILHLDTLLISNGCSSHSELTGLMTLLARTYPNFIDRNRTSQPPAGLDFAESARSFYDNQGAEFADEHVPWLVDIMPPSNWVYTLMAISLFFNFAGFLNNQRLAMIDLNRVALENDIILLFGKRVSNEEIRCFPINDQQTQITPEKLNQLIARYNHHLERCRRQSLSVLSPMGEEMGYRDQEIIMTATLDALNSLLERLTRKDN